MRRGIHSGILGVWLAIAGWLVLNLVLFLGPLLVFVGPLYALRERTLLDYGRLATEHHLAFHRKWIGEPKGAGDLLGSADASSAADLNASVESVRNTRLVPVDRVALIQLLAAAGLPMLAVIATRIALLGLAQWIVNTVL